MTKRGKEKRDWNTRQQDHLRLLFNSSRAEILLQLLNRGTTVIENLASRVTLGSKRRLIPDFDNIAILGLVSSSYFSILSSFLPLALLHTPAHTPRIFQANGTTSTNITTKISTLYLNVNFAQPVAQSWKRIICRVAEWLFSTTAEIDSERGCGQ